MKDEKKERQEKIDSLYATIAGLVTGLGMIRLSCKDLMNW